MNQFIYFITNPGNEPYLKEEIKNKYSDLLAFSYSKSGVCTFKNLQETMDLQSIKNLNIIFAKAWGETISLCKLDKVAAVVDSYLDKTELKLFLAHTKLSESEFIFEFENSCTLDEAQGYLLVINTHNDNYVIGVQLKDKFSSPPFRFFYELEEKVAPSRAYHKLKEAFMLLGVPHLKKLNCVEFGCAPGGSTQFLLENGHQVVGVDPALMDEQIMSHQNFRFLNVSMQDVKIYEMPKLIDILISDVNLAPMVVLSHLQKLFMKETPAPLALITLKTATIEIIPQQVEWKKALKRMGYKKVSFVQLSGHRKECLAIAQI